MTKFIKYLVLIVFLFCGNLIYAQEVTAFTLFATGNTFGENSDNKLLDQWKKQAGIQKDLAVLIAGNAVDSQTGQISGELLLKREHPLLIAPAKNEWAGGGRDGKDFIKKLNDKAKLFDRLVPLEHPRFIQQYKSKEKQLYIDKYILAFSGSVSEISQ